ncbi:MAG: hypothetical protein DLM54_09445 [Acidimicrobiales bacterium]|nr:MAG: hypothetical protein DLM54_09445 [Acidimicrobiales bacterium]
MLAASGRLVVQAVELLRRNRIELQLAHCSERRRPTLSLDPLLRMGPGFVVDLSLERLAMNRRSSLVTTAGGSRTNVPSDSSCIR